MAEELFIQLASNSSNHSDQSLPSKIAKLEARMTGRSSTSAAAAAVPVSPANAFHANANAVANVDASMVSSDSDSDDDDNGEDYHVMASIHKRQRTEEDSVAALDDVESAADARQKVAAKKSGSESNRRKQGRGRRNGTLARSRGSRLNYKEVQSSGPTVIPANDFLENSYRKDFCPSDQFGLHERALLEDENTSLRAKVAALEEDLRKMREEASDKMQHCQKLEKDLRNVREEASDNMLHCQKLEEELNDLKDKEQQMRPKMMKVLSDLLISVSKAERQEARMNVCQESLRLGNVGVIRVGTVISETWEDGKVLKDVNAHLRRLLETKEAIERQRKLFKKKQSDKGEGADGESGLQEEDLIIHDEIYKSRLASIKREEESCMRERDRYELEKGRLIREMKRIRDEDGSRFNNFPILNNRYALLNLLGKGGFSEVYKAFDLSEHRYVACKLHGLNAQWSEDKKKSYIRHALREYNIHKTLVHYNIVQLWDIFEIDQNTFCTVLEYCSGKDLDAVLKANPTLPEKEARMTIIQIFNGLVYLNKRTQKIIHYDLKPGNVLFDEFGMAKVTDFGLSKIVEDDVGSQGMELTSQGAGTYWYLPPECFELSKTPLISSKVDVWSAGILFYQMLFGKRPFGHDQTQERILREDTIIKARKVEFPSRPSVSSEAKELIRRCLTYNQAERPDVLTIAQDPYLICTKK